MTDDREPPSLPLVRSLPLVGYTPPAEREAPAPPASSAAASGARRRPTAIGRLGAPGLAIGLTIYLARALRPSSFGLYVLAIGIGTVALYVAWVVLPLIVARLRSVDPDDVEQTGRAPPSGRLAAVAVCVAVLFAAAAPIANAYGQANLQWPLRWAAALVAAQALVWALSQRSGATRETALGRAIVNVQCAVQTVDVVTLVVAGHGAAGAVLGRLSGSLVAVGGLLLFAPAIARVRSPEAVARAPVRGRRTGARARQVSDADATWGAIVLGGAVLVGALVTAPALGRFGAPLMLTAALGYAGYELSGLVAERAGRSRDSSLGRRLRVMLLMQGGMVAPLVVWAAPLAHLLFGHRYGASAGALRALAFCAVVAGPALLLTLSVARAAAPRPRMLATSFALEAGAIATYLLTRAAGITGAAIGVDVLLAVYLATNLRIAARVAGLAPATLLRSLARTTLAAIAMAAVLLAAGSHDLTAVGWVAGAIGGTAAFIAVLLITDEISVSRYLGAARGRSGRAGS